MNFRKMLFAVLCLMLALGLTLPAVAKAQQGESSTQQVPPPIVGSNKANSSLGSGNGISVSHGNGFSSTWSANRTYMLNNPSNPSQGSHLAEGFQGNLQPALNGTVFCLEFNLRSFESPYTSPTNPLGIWQNSSYGIPCAIWINCSEGEIPIWMYNASSFSFEVGNVTYIDGLPTLTNNVTFHDIALNTYGHGSSSVNLVLNQEIIANWTTMKVKIGVYADLSNMSLYLPNGSEIPHGTEFSLNFQWGIDLTNQTASQMAGYPIGFPYVATGTELYFLVNGTEQSRLSIADMTLGDNYKEIQGSAQAANRTAAVQFVHSPVTLGNDKGQGGVPSCNCFQSFNNLTYGVTTGILSDPTLTVNHAPVPVGWGQSGNPTGSNPLGPLQVLIIGIVATGAMAGILFIKRRHSMQRRKNEGK